MHLWNRMKITVPLLFAGTLISACASLPDTSDYVSASARFSLAVQSTGDVIEAEMLHAEQLLNAEQETGSANAIAVQTGRFRDAWQITEQAAEAMHGYTESIDAITSVDEASQSGLDAMATSLERLANIVDVALPTLPAVARIGIRELVLQIGRIRAAKNLENALELADPVIGEFSGVISEQLDRAEDTFSTVTLIRRSRVMDRSNFETEWLSLSRNIDSAAANFLAAPPDSNLAREREAELEELRARQELLRASYERFATDRDELVRTRQTGLETIEAAQTALADWNRAHRRLLIAVRDSEPFSVRSLLESVGRLQTALDAAEEASRLPTPAPQGDSE